MKRIIKYTSVLIVTLIFITAILIISSNSFDKKARACDEAYGYKCSYYQVQTFSNWKVVVIWLHKKRDLKKWRLLNLNN